VVVVAATRVRHLVFELVVLSNLAAVLQVTQILPRNLGVAKFEVLGHRPLTELVKLGQP